MGRTDHDHGFDGRLSVRHDDVPPRFWGDVRCRADANLGRRFDGSEMRKLLNNPATGTRSNNPPNDKIGVMPNLRAIIDRFRLPWRLAPMP